MWRKFCATTQQICEDGKPENSTALCCYWDSINEECSFARGVQVNTDYQKMLMEKMALTNAFYEKITKKLEPGEKTKPYNGESHWVG